MPAASSSAKVASRRKEKHLSPEELKDIEQKRLKGTGELSCAECRRLKLRCDKKLPCSSCSRRGCESICRASCGTLEAGVGTRFILASTNQLHTKISIMSSRIRALEDALAIFQASVSSERHPLLEDELLKIKFGSEVKNLEEPEVGSQEVEGSMISGGTCNASSVDTTTLDAFGTLTLGEEGEMKYFGRSAGSETLILAGENYVDSDEDESIPSLDSTKVRSDLPNSSNATTFAAGSSPTISHLHVLSFNEEEKDTVPPEIYALALDHNQGTEARTYLTVLDLLKHLPPRSRAEALAEAYIDHASLFFRAMKKDELFGTVLPLLYPLPDPSSDVSSSSVPTVSSESQIFNSDSEGSNGRALPSPHLLSVIFFIFALGAFFDLSASIKSYVSESQLWFELGTKALICKRGTIVHPKDHIGGGDSHSPGHQFPSDDGIHAHHPLDMGKIPMSTPPSSAEDTVRALGLMATYCSMSGKKHARDSAWCGMSLAAKVAQGSGMHRDPDRWHMDPATVQRRRALWWEVCTSDISHSVALGRPPSIHLSFVDCEFPTDEEVTLSDTGEEIMGFWRMKYTFAKESFTPVISTTLSAKSPTYSTIMDLDRKVRELSLPPGFKPYVSLYEDGPEIYHNSHLALRDFYASQHRTVTMLYLHRSFFAHAMLTHPSNPLMSPFALSFLAAYRAASVIIKAAVHFYDRCPAVVPRVWFLTYHVFSAAMTVGTVVKRSPNSSIARSALNDLGQALDLFEKCANSSPRNRIAHALLRRLKEKADRAYTDYLAKTKDSANLLEPAKTTLTKITSSTVTEKVQQELNTSFFSRTNVGADDNELAIWGGKTSLLNGVGKRKVRGKDALRNTSGSSSSAVSPSDSIRMTLSPSSPTSSPTYQSPAAFSSRNEWDASNINFDPSIPYLGSSHHSETFWDDAMDAQIHFDANLDLSSMSSATALPPQMSSQLASTAMDINMIDASVPDFGNVDFGLKLGDGFGAGTTGSRGLLMDMALEDIAPFGRVAGGSTSNYDRPSHSTAENQVLMEYLSGTADPRSTTLRTDGLFGPYTGPNTNVNNTNANLPWAGSNVLSSMNVGSDPNTGVASAASAARPRFDSSIAELYLQFLHHFDPKTQVGTQNVTLNPSSSSTFSEGIGPGWAGERSALLSEGLSSVRSGENQNMSFESLMGSGLNLGFNSPMAINSQGTDNPGNSLDPQSSPLWNSNASNLDPAFMHNLTRFMN